MNRLVSHCNNTLDIPDYVRTAMRAIERAGHETWCVGGCVRDALLGRPVHDFDLAASCSWTDTENALARAGFAIHRTGIEHGTVTASINGNVLEITTYRSDGTYTDGRHPDAVTFVSSIEEDLARRDFTINALAYHPKRGLLDCFGGLEDLDHGVIRAVGDAAQRFSEDALRILRACRFASQLGFGIAPTTMQAMRQNKMRMLGVSSERITHELSGLLLGDHVHDALLECVDVLAAVMPELYALKGFDQHTPYHIYDVLEHTAWVVQRVPATPLARWAALFHDFGKPGAFFMDGDRGHFYGHPRLSVVLARDVMNRLCLSPGFREDVLTLVRMHDVVIGSSPRSVKRALSRMNGNVDLFRTLCSLKRADALAQSDLSEPRVTLACELERTLDAVLANNDAFTTSMLAINGDDVISLGIAEGPEVGKALRLALEAVIDEEVPNERDALLALIKTARESA